LQFNQILSYHCRRGKPLFLSADRYQLLESQWLTHRFDHTNRKWIWHRESL
jgi:E3 ubiquitin-protein ligase UBR3